MKQDWCNIPIKVTVRNNQEKNDIDAWLQHNIDNRDYDCDYTQYFSMYNYITVYFAKSKDAMLFSLRWS